MTRSTMAGAALGAILGAVLALPVGAATVVATWTGTVFGSTDQTGVFGGDPGDPGYDPSGLDGQAFSLAFTFDTDLGTRDTVPGSFDQLQGGSLRGLPSPGSAALTIGGETQAVEGGFDFLAFVEPESLSLLAQEEVFTPDGEGNSATTSGRIGASFADLTASLIPDLERALSLDLDGLVSSGSFSFLDFTCDAAAETCTDTRVAFGSLDLDRLTVAVDGGGEPSPVPLPASGLLLLAALGGAGGLGLKRRR